MAGQNAVIRVLLLGVVLAVTLGLFVLKGFETRSDLRLGMTPDEVERARAEAIRETLAGVPATPSTPSTAPRSPKEPPKVVAASGNQQLVVSETTLDTTTPDGVPAPPPYFPITMDYDHQAIWLAKDEDIDDGVSLWDPSTGVLKSWPLEHGPFSFLVPPTPIATSTGLFLIGGQHIDKREWLYDPTRVALVTRDGHLLMARLQVERDRPSLLALRDQSVLVVGGCAEQCKKRGGSTSRRYSNAVERISLVDGKMHIDRLADLPGEPRTGISLVELPDGRVMALGGSSGQYLGSKPMSAQSWFLDPVSGKWAEGPMMNTAREKATATLLDQGDVLVVGGWTPENDWQNGPSDSVELWVPEQNRFFPLGRLPLRVAGHQAVWSGTGTDRHLLVAGGMVGAWNGNRVVLGYDQKEDRWQTRGENCIAHNRDGSLFLAPLTSLAPAQIWCMETKVPIERAWSVVALRSPGEENKTPLADKAGIALQRSRFGFLPPKDELPGLVVGGAVSGTPTAIVDALWLDGRMLALAPLNHARTWPQVFRLPQGGIVVVGGADAVRGNRSDPSPSPEILFTDGGLEQAHWQDLALPLPPGAVWGQLRDGSFLILKPGGAVEQLTLSRTEDGAVHIARRDFPSLNRSRRWYRMLEKGMDVVIRELADGRIVVAGGQVPRHRIALLDADVFSAGGETRYVGTGQDEASLQYEIYDPVAKRWHESARSLTEGDLAAILADGRVVKWGVDRPWAVEDEEHQPVGILQISSADGSAWQQWPAASTPAIEVSNYGYGSRPFVLDDELFLSGALAQHRSGIGMDAVQWFNAASRKWETVWELPPGEKWRDHIGRVVIRSLANGKRVMLPVTER